MQADLDTPEHHVEVLADNRELFERIAENESLPRWLRRKYGERPLDILDAA